MADFPKRGHKTLGFRQFDSSLNKTGKRQNKKRHKVGKRNNMGEQKRKISRPRTTSPQAREPMVKELKQSHETKNTQIIILKQPIWQTHGIYQKTIDEMSLERPIKGAFKFRIIQISGNVSLTDWWTYGIRNTAQGIVSRYIKTPYYHNLCNYCKYSLDSRLFWAKL